MYKIQRSFIFCNAFFPLQDHFKKFKGVAGITSFQSHLLTYLVLRYFQFQVTYHLMHHFNYQYYKGSVDLLSHFAKCKNQKCQFQILQEIDFGTIIRIKNILHVKFFSTLYFLSKVSNYINTTIFQSTHTTNQTFKQWICAPNLNQERVMCTTDVPKIFQFGQNKSPHQSRFQGLVL